MSTLTIRLPDSLHGKIREFAKADGISINQFLTSAAAEKMAALLTVDYLRRESALADSSAFRAALKKAPAVRPDPGDEIS